MLLYYNIYIITLFLARNTPLSECNVYWDGGPDKIAAFHTQHTSMCGSNWVCTRLGLKDAIVEPDTHKANSPEKAADRQSIGFLIN